MKIYLDNSMTTRPSERAVSAMMPYLTDQWGTPSAPHRMGEELHTPIRKSYEQIYALLGAPHSDDFVFTSSGAEAINHVIFSVYRDIALPTGKTQFITASTDEAPAIMAIGRLEEQGAVGKMVEPDERGQITAEAIGDAITPRTALVSLSWANGLTGVVHPVGEIASLCQERGILFHLDATHVLGKLFYELDDVGADFITFNGDHLHAPKGTGGLYIKKATPCSPFILGGIEQGGYRAGSYNVPGLIALGEASQEALDARDLMCTEVARLKNRFEEGVKEGISGAQVLFQNSERLPHVTAIAFPNCVNEALLYALNQKGVYASIGGGSFQQIALLAKQDPILAQTVISFSLSRETTEEEIEKAIALIVETVQEMQKLGAAL